MHFDVVKTKKMWNIKKMMKTSETNWHMFG